MITAVDTSVLLAIYKGEADSELWLSLILAQSEFDKVVVCDVVVAEVSALFQSDEETLAFIRDIGIVYDSVEPASALLAGRIFKTHRRAGGPRDHLIPRFLIGAHAHQQCNQLAAKDKGYLRRYFPSLKIVTPK